MAWTKVETEEARATLRDILKPGQTVYTVLRNVSRSGMTRSIDLYVIDTDDDRSPWIRCISYLAARAGGFSWDSRRDAIKVGGCGMDMGFHIVYGLSHALWPDGLKCAGNQDARGNHHASGGYALRHQWI